MLRYTAVVTLQYKLTTMGVYFALERLMKLPPKANVFCIFQQMKLENNNQSPSQQTVAEAARVSKSYVGICAEEILNYRVPQQSRIQFK